MNTIKKEIVNFGNTLMSMPGGEVLILDSFAAMYIALRKAKCDVKNPKYQLLNTLFKKLGIVPKMGEDGEITYKTIEKKEKKENPFEKVENKKDNKDFFKKKNQNNSNTSKCANCKHKNYCTYVLHNSGEKDLIDDIFFSLEKEIGGLIYIFNKL